MDTLAQEITFSDVLLFLMHALLFLRYIATAARHHKAPVSSYFVNCHFVNSYLVNVDKVGNDKVGIDQVGIHQV